MLFHAPKVKVVFPCLWRKPAKNFHVHDRKSWKRELFCVKKKRGQNAVLRNFTESKGHDSCQSLFGSGRELWSKMNKSGLLRLLRVWRCAVKMNVSCSDFGLICFLFFLSDYQGSFWFSSFLLLHCQDGHFEKTTFFKWNMVVVQKSFCFSFCFVFWFLCKQVSNQFFFLNFL